MTQQPQNLDLTKSRLRSSKSDGKSNLLEELSALMAAISVGRAELMRQESALSDLHRRMDTEFRPLQESLLEIRLDTFRILGKHLLAGFLNKRRAQTLESALLDLAQSLETEFGLDLREDRLRFFEEAMPKEQDLWDGSELEEFDPQFKSKHRSQKNNEPEFAADALPSKKAAPNAGDIRALYLMLARALHPDKEPNPDRLLEKTAWMQKVTAAYAERDLAKLLDILAANPLDALGPYLSEAPLKTVRGFAKRLRRDLDELHQRLKDWDRTVDPGLSRFLKNGFLHEVAYGIELAKLRKDLKFVKQRRDLYRTTQGLEGLILALRRHDWQELM